MNTLTLKQLRTTTDAGGIAGVTLQAQGGAFIVKIDTRSGGKAVLSKSRSAEPREFGDPIQALALLRGLGLFVGAFDVEQWDPQQKSRRTRPDRAKALKLTHEAAEHDKWFREQVRQGLAEANDPNAEWVTHDAVKLRMQQQREMLQTRITGKAK
ncbi:hypothetical protein C9426_30050 [Serratia sp. S1B]|nr:hypothetical protein C9426_30050 [Serratia sp. S1B]